MSNYNEALHIKMTFNTWNDVVAATEYLKGWNMNLLLRDKQAITTPEMAS